MKAKFQVSIVLEVFLPRLDDRPSRIQFTGSTAADSSFISLKEEINRNRLEH
jgi:hypothetical protein